MENNTLNNLLDKDELNVSIGKKIRSKRMQIGYTQDSICKLLGITQNALSRMENGKCHPELFKLVLLCDLFMVDMNFFIPLNSFDKRNKRIADLENINKKLTKRNELLETCIEEFLKTK